MLRFLFVLFLGIFSSSLLLANTCDFDSLADSFHELRSDFKKTSIPSQKKSIWKSVYTNKANPNDKIYIGFENSAPTSAFSRQQFIVTTQRKLNSQFLKHKAQTKFFESSGPTIFWGYTSKNSSSQVKLRSFQVSTECVFHTLIRGNIATTRKYEDIVEEIGFLASDYAGEVIFNDSSNVSSTMRLAIIFVFPILASLTLALILKEFSRMSSAQLSHKITPIIWLFLIAGAILNLIGSIDLENLPTELSQVTDNIIFLGLLAFVSLTYIIVKFEYFIVIGISLAGILNTIALLYLSEVEDLNAKTAALALLIIASIISLWSTRNILLEKEDRIRQHNWR